MKRWFLMLIILSLTVAGCAADNAANFLDSNYNMVDARPSRYGTDDVAKVYQIPVPVDIAAKLVSEKYPPKDMTDKANTERMVLVYPKYVVDIYDENGQTLAEVASQRYVRDHYASGGFFRGYLAATIVRDIFDGPRSWRSPKYPPYGGRTAIPNYGKTVREGSVGSRGFRGGGIFGGK